MRSMFSFVGHVLLLFLSVTALSYLVRGDVQVHRLSIMISSPKTFKVGDAIRVDIKLTNVSDTPLTITRNRQATDFYSIDVRDSHGNAVGDTEAHRKIKKDNASKHALSSVTSINIKPGETYLDTIEPSFYYDMSQPGTYTIQVSTRGKGGIKSNVITVTVVPR